MHIYGEKKKNKTHKISYGLEYNADDVVAN